MSDILLIAYVALLLAAEDDRLLALRYVFRKQPQRGDVVVFETPESGRRDCGAGGIFVKRIMACPGRAGG